MQNPWGSFEYSNSELICPVDEEVIQRYNEFQRRKAEHRLYLEIIPEPYIGNLEKCQLLILMANPGWSEGDYEDHRQTEMRDLAIRNLRQEPMDWPFYLLHPKIRNRSGGQYWAKRFAGFQKELAESLRIDQETALMELSRRVAVAELHPYHSKKFDGAPALLGLGSSKFTHWMVGQAVGRGCSIMIARGISLWSTHIEPFPRTFLATRSSQASGAITERNLVRTTLEGVSLKTILGVNSTRN